MGYRNGFPAYQFLEEMRWNGTPICPHCDIENVAYMNPANGTSRKTRTGAASQRRIWQCVVPAVSSSSTTRPGEHICGNVSTNKAENFCSQLKRSVDGTHHHVSVEHLPRYLAEFGFRYSTRMMTDTAACSA